MKNIYFIGILLFCLCNPKSLFAQEIRVEGFVGTEAPSIDIFWLRPFAKETHSNSEFPVRMSQSHMSK